MSVAHALDTGHMVDVVLDLGVVADEKHVPVAAVICGEALADESLRDRATQPRAKGKRTQPTSEGRNELGHPQNQPLVDGAMLADRRWLHAHPHMRTRHRLSIPNAGPVLLLDRCGTLVRPLRRFGRSRFRVDGALPDRRHQRGISSCGKLIKSVRYAQAMQGLARATVSSNEHSASQLLERLGWAVTDAERAPAVAAH